MKVTYSIVERAGLGPNMIKTYRGRLVRSAGEVSVTLDDELGETEVTDGTDPDDACLLASRRHATADAPAWDWYMTRATLRGCIGEARRASAESDARALARARKRRAMSV